MGIFYSKKSHPAENAATNSSTTTSPSTQEHTGNNVAESLERPSVEDGIRREWEREQEELKQKLILVDTDPWAKLHLMVGDPSPSQEQRPLEYVGGVDISFVKGDSVNACAAVVVVKLPEMQVVYEDCSLVEMTAPYIPGFLAFREAGFLVDKINRLHTEQPHLMPQVILVDGNGILHPREFGLACHLGVLLDLPAVGVAKKLFQVDGLEKDTHHKDKVQELKKGGDTFPLIGASGKVLGMALRSCDSTTNPVYVSQGHKISMETALWVVKICCKHRVPEPVRQADIRSREYLRQHFEHAAGGESV